MEKGRPERKENHKKKSRNRRKARKEKGHR